MRVAVLVAMLALLAACKAEPDFDARYDKAAKEIEARARAMDAGIAEGLPEAVKPSNPASSSGE